MKKIWIFILTLAILSGCNSQNSVVENTKIENNNTPSVSLNNNTKQETKTRNETKIIENNKKDVEENNKKDNTNNQTEEELNKELTTMDSRLNSTKKYNFYMLDCNKEFKTKNLQKDCQEYSLKEAIVGCTDNDGPGKLKIEELFDYNKYNLIDKSDIDNAKKSCIENRKELNSIKEENKVDKFVDIDSKIKNMKLEDCAILGDKLEKKGYFSISIVPGKKITKEKELENKKIFENNCKLSYILKHRKSCDLLDNDKLKSKCQTLKKDVELYFKIKNIESYMDFDIHGIYEQIYGIDTEYPSGK